MLNGKPFYITSNLHSALLVIRRNNTSPRIWIDAICIDQNDDAEKEQQIKIMHQIYKHATNVRVWLGNEGKSVDLHAGLALVSHCLAKYEQVRGRRNSKLESDWNIVYFTVLDTVRWRFKECKKQSFVQIQKIDWHAGPEYSSGWKAIKEILTRSYFTRSWIIQEIVLSSNRSIFIGDHDITDILRFVELLHANPEIQRGLPSECRIEPEVTLRIHHLIQSIREYNGALNLGKLLATFRGKGSKMPEDQIYSLLGLTMEKNASYNGHRHVKFPEIDYKQSIQKLCTDTTKYILAHDNNLDVLRMLNTHAKPINEKQWPSWVPDFTSPLPALGEPKSAYWNLPPEYLSIEKLPEDEIFHIEGDKLLVYGHVLGEIRKPIRVVERDKELEYEKQHSLSDLEFLPMSVWEDSEGREVHGSMDVKKGDLVVKVMRGMNPLILRRRKDAWDVWNVWRSVTRKESEWPEYSIVGTADIPELKFHDFAKKMRWDFQKMAIV